MSQVTRKREKRVNLCLMAHNDEINFEHQLDFTFEELQDAFLDLWDEFKKLSMKNKV